MIIIKIMGGFASQVYKFILGAKIADVKKTKLVLDVSDYYDGYFRPYCLNELDLPEYETIRTRDISKDYPNLVWIHNSADMQKMINDTKDRDYYIYREESDYADFFQAHPEYELGIESPYIKSIKLKEKSKFLSTFREQIEDCTSVAIHIRRGDFVTLGQEDDGAYYKAAIAYFYEKDPNTKFFFFSNDLEWVRKEFGEWEEFYYVTAINGNIGDMEELFCMSFCKYRILSSISGYGQLANVLSYYENESGFALMKEPEIEQYDYKGIEGRIQYLNKKQILKWNALYNEIKWSEVVKNEQHTDLDKLGISHVYSSEMKNTWMMKRLLSYKDNKKRALECLESISQYTEQNVNLQKFWEEIYKIKFENKKRFYIVTCEAYSPWFRRGLYEIGIRLARLGQEVKYINLFNTTEKENKCVDACNMDGKSYGFQIYKGNLVGINEELQESDIIICDCKFKMPIQPTVIKCISLKAKKREREYYKFLLKYDWKLAIETIIMRNANKKQRECFQLNEYWENILHKKGKSYDDVQESLEMIYSNIMKMIV